MKSGAWKIKLQLISGLCYICKAVAEITLWLRLVGGDYVKFINCSSEDLSITPEFLLLMSWISFASLLYIMTKSNHPSSIFLTTYKLNFKVRTTQRCLIEIFHIFQQSVYKLLKASPILWESLYIIHGAVSWRYWRKTNSYTAPTLTRKRWVRACLDTFASCDSTYQPWSLTVLRVGEF